MSIHGCAPGLTAALSGSEQAELNDVMRDLFTKKSTLLEQLQKAPECGDEVQEAIQVLLDQNTGMEEDVQEIAGCSLTEIQQVGQLRKGRRFRRTRRAH